ncbi:MAG: RNA polymerase subunit sigma-70 [Robiginitomaculum sp.]|nr:MAG: RNA polymerase subunit sigma-70 [Robiginitomaculum sp.]
MRKSNEPTANQNERSLDNERIEEYVQQFKPALLAFFSRRTTHSEIAQDLVQDVFMRLLRRKKSGEIEHPAAYIMQTASSVWNDFLRTKQRRHEDMQEEFDEFSHSPGGISPEREYIGREAVNIILSVLSKLPTRTQDIYLLCRFDGFKRHEAAKRMGISVSAIDKHLMIATKKVGQIFGEYNE